MGAIGHRAKLNELQSLFCIILMVKSTRNAMTMFLKKFELHKMQKMGKNVLQKMTKFPKDQFHVNCLQFIISINFLKITLIFLCRKHTNKMFFEALTAIIFFRKIDIFTKICIHAIQTVFRNNFMLKTQYPAKTNISDI